MTAAIEAEDYHTFANETKTATDWAVSFKLTVEANDCLGPIEIQAISLSFD